MAALKLKREHGGSGVEEGKSFVRHVLEAMDSTLSKHVDEISWNDQETEATLRGKHIKGSFRVDDRHMHIDLKLSMVASLIKARIIQRIDQVIAEQRA